VENHLNPILTREIRESRVADSDVAQHRLNQTSVAEILEWLVHDSGVVENHLNPILTREILESRVADFDVAENHPNRNRVLALSG
jgi:hypothetical protein